MSGFISIGRGVGRRIGKQVCIALSNLRLMWKVKLDYAVHFGYYEEYQSFKPEVKIPSKQTLGEILYLTL